MFKLRNLRVLFLVFLVSFTAANDEVINKRRHLYKQYKNKVVLNGCFEVRPCGSFQRPKLGAKENPASSCKAILDNTDGSAPSGPYYIKTNPTVTKVYCYMKDMPGYGGAGWTTIMKIDGSKTTFRFDSALWKNKMSYHVIDGQTGTDEQETKLPTYWTLPFTRLCFGMKTKLNQQLKWICLNYKASSLYSVIADGKYRSFSIGRSQWKSLIAGSSLQNYCNIEGFNLRGTAPNTERVRIGIISNNDNNCNTPDSSVGFGVYVVGDCHSKMSTGNCARKNADNGNVTITAYGYILAQ